MPSLAASRDAGVAYAGPLWLGRPPQGDAVGPPLMRRRRLARRQFGPSASGRTPQAFAFLIPKSWSAFPQVLVLGLGLVLIPQSAVQKPIRTGRSGLGLRPGQGTRTEEGDAHSELLALNSRLQLCVFPSSPAPGGRYGRRRPHGPRRSLGSADWWGGAGTALPRSTSRSRRLLPFP